MFNQRNWLWCNRCQGITFAGNPSQGRCPAGGAHTHHGSWNYQLSDEAGHDFQGDWYWCSACSVLFHWGESEGVCPEDPSGRHNPHASSRYTLQFSDTEDARHQAGWCWCHKCRGLFFKRNPSLGVCPAGGEHDPSRSAAYRLTVSEFPTDEPPRILTWRDFFRTEIIAVRGPCVRTERRSHFERLGDSPPFEFVTDECVEWAVEHRAVRVPMSEGDIIDVSIAPNIHPPDIVRFELRTDAALTWWKGVQIGARQLVTRDAAHLDSCFVPVTELGPIYFAKARLRGVWYRIYRVNETIPGGSNVIFSWRRD